MTVSEINAVIKKYSVAMLLQYKGTIGSASLNGEIQQALLLPINPKEITITNPIYTEEIKCIDKTINVLGNKGIRKITIDSLIPAFLDNLRMGMFSGVFPAIMYINWIKNWIDQKIPANFIVTGIDGFTMRVYPKSFKYSAKAGEEGAYYYTLELEEYVPYKAKSKVESVSKLLSETISESMVFPWLIPTGRPIRDLINKQKVWNQYVIKANDTIDIILQKIYGDNWTDDDKQKLLNRNTKCFDSNGDLITGGIIYFDN